MKNIKGDIITIGEIAETSPMKFNVAITYSVSGVMVTEIAQGVWNIGNHLSLVKTELGKYNAQFISSQTIDNLDLYEIINSDERYNADLGIINQKQ